MEISNGRRIRRRHMLRSRQFMELERKRERLLKGQNFHVVFIIHVILFTVRHRMSSWGCGTWGIFSS
jgi:hypothetical protein